MADETKRIIDQDNDQTLSAGDYVMVDSQSEGTRKFDLGSELRDIKEDLAEIEGGGLSDDAKAALLACFQNVAWIGTDGDDYYQDLYDALYPPAPPATLSYITCVYTQSGTVYDTDSLNDLKSDLVVTAHYDNGTTSVVTNYTLSGTLVAGTSTITVSYSGKTTTFNVTVTHASDPSEEWTDGVPYNYTLVANEYVSSGNIISYNGWSRTPYLPCHGISRVSITGWSQPTGTYSAWYDSTKTYIPNSSFRPTEANLANVPEGACYLIISQSDSNMNAITSITPYA